MRILFDQGCPAPLRKHNSKHSVVLSKELGWERLKNGELLDRAEQAGFDMLLTTDKSIRYQQNLSGRQIAVFVLDNPDWNVLKLDPRSVVDALDGAVAGDYKVI